MGRIIPETMIAARVSFGPLSSEPDTRETQIDLADGYLVRLFKNGQTGEHWINAHQNGRHVAYVTLARPDAHQKQYGSTWEFLVPQHEALVETFGQEPQWTLLDDSPEAHAEADWRGAPSLVLYTLWADENSLVSRGDTGDEVAVYLLPVSNLEREGLVHWGMHFRDLDRVWLSSGDLEIPAYKQLVEPESTLMSDGRHLARAVEAATKLPTYVYLPRYWGRRTGEAERLCPGCGNAWHVGENRDAGYLEGFAFRCDDCRLVSDMASDTTDERHARLGEYRAPKA